MNSGVNIDTEVVLYYTWFILNNSNIIIITSQELVILIRLGLLNRNTDSFIFSIIYAFQFASLLLFVLRKPLLS